MPKQNSSKIKETAMELYEWCQTCGYRPELIQLQFSNKSGLIMISILSPNPSRKNNFTEYLTV